MILKATLLGVTREVGTSTNHTFVSVVSSLQIAWEVERILIRLNNLSTP